MSSYQHSIKPDNILKGFTLIELVITLIIIGILAVSAAPLFRPSNAADIASYEARLLSVLRLQQQRAMQDTATGTSYCVLVSDNRFGVPGSCAAPSLPLEFDPEFEGLGVSEQGAIAVNSTQNLIYFNALGCPATTSNGTCGSLAVQYTIAGQPAVCVQSQGYIRAGAC